MQRYVRLFGTPIALLGLVAFLLWGGWWGYKNVVAPIPPKPPTPCTTQAVGSALKSSQVTVNVFNGGTTVGLAGQVSGQLTAVGFKIGRVGNTDEKVTRTVVVGAKATDPEVKLVLGFFKGATVKADNRVDHTVDVLVGSNFGGVTASAPRQIAVASGRVCLPSPTPTTGS